MLSVRVAGYRFTPRFPDQRDCSTESKAAGLEKRPPDDVRSAVLSGLSAGLDVQVPQKGTLLQ